MSRRGQRAAGRKQIRRLKKKRSSGAFSEAKFRYEMNLLWRKLKGGK